MPASTYGRQVVLALTNKSGGSVAAGDVVIVDTTNNDAFTTTTSGAFTGLVGVAQEGIANNATGRVLTEGYAALVNVNASVTRGNYGKTHTVVKQATDAGSSRVVGAFCQFLTAGTTPDAVVYHPDLGSGSGSVASDAIWTTSGKAAIATGTATATEQWPPGHEFDYASTTSSPSITATTEGTSQTVIAGNAVTYSGSDVVMINFYASSVLPDAGAGGNFVRLVLYEDSTVLGYIGLVRTPAAANMNIPVFTSFRRTPSNASHTYTVKAFVNSGTGTVSGGAGGTGANMPIFIRVIKV